MIDAEEDPDLGVSVADNAASEKGSRIMDVLYVIDGRGVLVSFHVVSNPDDVT